MKKFFKLRTLSLALLLALSVASAQIVSVYAQSTGLQQWGGGNIGFSLTCGAGGGYNVHGKLFSSTIGWIYLNCADYGQNITDFGVNQDSGGYWNGYGWSSSVGWVKFGNGYGGANVGYPQHPGWNVQPANGASGHSVQHLSATGIGLPLVGWARACTAALDPSTCTGERPQTDPETGGWDGWISMNGLNDQNPTAAGVQTTQNYSSQLSILVNQNGQQNVTGFVWGGDVIGWAKFQNAYVDVNQTIPAAHITLTPSSSTLTGAGQVSLMYSIPQAEKAYFTGAPCTATSTPSVGNSWNGSQQNFSSTSTAFSNTVPNVQVPGAPGATVTYQISCPVSIPNSTQTAATATTTVSIQAATGTLSVGAHDLCVASSYGGPVSTQASWVGPTGASYAKFFEVQNGNATAIGGQQPVMGSMTLGPFTTATSTNYTTPTQAGQQHEYFVKWYDNNNNVIAESNQGQHEFVGVAPATFNGQTANGTLDCTTPQYGIALGGGGIACQGDPATLSWAPSFGTVPPQYTYARLKMSVNGPNGQYSTTVGGQYGLTDSETNVVLGGWYKVFYYDTNGVAAPVSSGPVQVTLSNAPNCSTYQMNGISNAGPYCPAGSVNTAALLPKTYGWTSNAANCTLSGPQSKTGANGTFSISSGTLGTYSLTCTWSDGTTTSSQGTYGPMAAEDSAFCSTIHPPAGRPVIIEN